MNALIDNPIFVKHARSRLRRQQVMPSIIIVGVVAVLLMYAGFALDGLDNGVIFTFFFIGQGIILILMGTNQVAMTVTAARESEILDFHRVSPLSPAAIALGFLVGAPIREYLLAALLIPFAAICAALGPPGLFNYLILLALLVSSTLLFHSLAVISGLIQVRIKRGNSATVLVVLAHIFGGQILGGIALPATLTVIPAFTELMAGNLAGGLQLIPKFFGVEAPIWAQSFAYQIPLTAFLFLACVRRMHSAEAPMYSKLQACGFLMTLAALTLAGLIDPPVQQVADVARVGALLTMTLAGLVLVACVTPESGTVANGFRRIERLGQRHVSLWDDASHNAFIAGLLGVIVLASGEVAAMLLPPGRLMQVEHVHIPPVVAGLAVTYFGWALQFFHLKYRRRARSYFTVFLFVLWGVPLILAAILGLQFRGGELPELIASISPLASITTGSITGLIAAIIPALVFGVLLRETISQFERQVHEFEVTAEIEPLPEM